MSASGTSGYSTGNRWFHYGYGTSGATNDDTFNTAKLQLNGHDRFTARDASYFRKVQNYEHHTPVPRTPAVTAAGNGVVVKALTTTTQSAAAADIASPWISFYGKDNDAPGAALDASLGIGATSVAATTAATNNQAAASKNGNFQIYLPTSFTQNQNLAQYIYTYSFALSPEEHQPSGTCNFSRIDNAVLQIDYTDKTAAKNLKVFAVNYNVLRIMSGMGGLAYSN